MRLTDASTWDCAVADNGGISVRQQYRHDPFSYALLEYDPIHDEVVASAMSTLAGRIPMWRHGWEHINACLNQRNPGFVHQADLLEQCSQHLRSLPHDLIKSLMHLKKCAVLAKMGRTQKAEQAKWIRASQGAPTSVQQSPKSRGKGLGFVTRGRTIHPRSYQIPMSPPMLQDKGEEKQRKPLVEVGATLSHSDHSKVSNGSSFLTEASSDHSTQRESVTEAGHRVADAVFKEFTPAHQTGKIAQKQDFLAQPMNDSICMSAHATDAEDTSAILQDSNLIHSVTVLNSIDIPDIIGGAEELVECENSSSRRASHAVNTQIAQKGKGRDEIHDHGEVETDAFISGRPSDPSRPRSSETDYSFEPNKQNRSLHQRSASKQLRSAGSRETTTAFDWLTVVESSDNPNGDPYPYVDALPKTPQSDLVEKHRIMSGLVQSLDMATQKYNLPETRKSAQVDFEILDAGAEESEKKIFHSHSCESKNGIEFKMFQNPFDLSQTMDQSDISNWSARHVDLRGQSMGKESGLGSDVRLKMQHHTLHLSMYQHENIVAGMIRRGLSEGNMEGNKTMTVSRVVVGTTAGRDIQPKTRNYVEFPRQRYPLFYSNSIPSMGTHPSFKKSLDPYHTPDIPMQSLSKSSCFADTAPTMSPGILQMSTRIPSKKKDEYSTSVSGLTGPTITDLHLPVLFKVHPASVHPSGALTERRRRPENAPEMYHLPQNYRAMENYGIRGKNIVDKVPKSFRIDRRISSLQQQASRAQNPLGLSGITFSNLLLPIFPAHQSTQPVQAKNGGWTSNKGNETGNTDIFERSSSSTLSKDSKHGPHEPAAEFALTTTENDEKEYALSLQCVNLLNNSFKVSFKQPSAPSRPQSKSKSKSIKDFSFALNSPRLLQRSPQPRGMHRERSAEYSSVGSIEYTQKSTFQNESKLWQQDNVLTGDIARMHLSHGANSRNSNSPGIGANSPRMQPHHATYKEATCFLKPLPSLPSFKQPPVISLPHEQVYIYICIYMHMYIYTCMVGPHTDDARLTQMFSVFHDLQKNKQRKQRHSLCEAR